MGKNKKIFKEKKRLFWLFRRYWQKAVVIALIMVMVASNFFFFQAPGVLAATFHWLQTDWSGGADTVNFPSHPTNQTGWTRFWSREPGIDNLSMAGQLSLTPTPASTIQTTDTDFNAGTLTNVAVRETGVAGEVVLGAGGPDGTSWRTPITIIGSTAGALTDFQVRVEVPFDTAMQANFNDVRFTAADRTTRLSHWRESFVASTSAVFWVRVPSIPASPGTIRIYLFYGHATISTASDGAATFDFFDDFIGTAIDTTRWNVVNAAAGSVTVAGGSVTIASTGDWWGTTDTGLFINSIPSFPHNYIAETFVIRQGAEKGNRFFGLRSSAATTARMFVLLNHDHMTRIQTVWRATDGATAGWQGTGTGIANPGNNVIARFDRIGDTVHAFYAGQHVHTGTVAGWGLNHIALTDTDTPAHPTQFDWIRVRKHASPKPTAVLAFPYSPLTIRIDNTANPSTLTEHQVRVVVNTREQIINGHMQPDGRDIRFFDGAISLPYWIESGINTTATVLWVRVPSIPANSVRTIEMRFNNPAASPASSGAATFDFFDDFLGTAIDTTRWNIVDATGWNVSGGELRGTNTAGRLTSVPVFSAPVILEIFSRIQATAWNGHNIGGFWLSATDGITLQEHIQQINTDRVRNNADIINIGKRVPLGGVPFTVTFRVIGTSVTITVVRMDTGVQTYSGSFTNTVLNERIMLGRNIDEYGSGQTYDAFWDWIRVRKHASPEPSVSVVSPAPTLIRERILFSSGNLISSAIDTGQNSDFTTLGFTITRPVGTDLRFQLRTSTTSAELAAAPWRGPDGTALTHYTVSGATINPIHDGHRWIQYRADFSTTDTTITPILSDITINYQLFPASAGLISSPYNTGNISNTLTGIAWSQILPTGTVIRFQLRTSPDNLTWTSWLGPDGTSGTFFTDPLGGEAIPAILRDGINDQWIQYQVWLVTTNSAFTPILSDVTLTYFLDVIPPSISINPVTTPTNVATQTLTGAREEGATVTLSANTAASFNPTTIAGPGATWTSVVTLIEGSNTITATATDAAGNTAAGITTIVLETAIIRRPIPIPIISDIEVIDITSNQAVIIWRTDIPAISRVEYGTNPAYRWWIEEDRELTSEHRITLSNLKPDTLYHFQVISDGAHRGRAISPDHIFRTLTIEVIEDVKDVAGIAVTPTTGLIIAEDGTTDTFTVVLNTQPTADVTIGLSTSDTTEGMVSPTSLTFTSANWNVAQTVTVTGVDDFMVDGNIAYTIITAPAVSADPHYSGRDASDVSVTNNDNDIAGITVAPITGLITTEAAGTATFTVVLTSEPTADVSIALSSSNTAEGTVSPTSLTFTSANWNVAQTVTVTGVDDFMVDGNIAYTIITAPAVSADPHYSGVNANDVSATNIYEAPFVFQDKWDLLPQRTIDKFVFTPLPKEIKKLAEKFPKLEEILTQADITRITDIARLKAVRLTLPGLTERMGLPTIKIEPGKFALPVGIPVVKLAPEVKGKMPTDIVFARTAGEMIDFNITLTITKEGEPIQKISTITNSPLQLVVRPEKPVKSIKGYLVLRSRSPVTYNLKHEIQKLQVSRFKFQDLAASLFFALPSFAKEYNPTEIETRFVLMKFEYNDFDGDGIYIAEIQTPLVEGEYEIITLMDYEDPELGKKEIRLITLIDPEGYIYEKYQGREIRILGAIVSIYWFNPETKQYEIWPAEKFLQKNPQITDITGRYSFLVPEGTYFIRVEAPGYLIYEGKPFQVREGRGVHINVELKSEYWWLKVIDWKTILLIIFGALLLYNFYRDKMRDKALEHKT